MGTFYFHEEKTLHHFLTTGFGNIKSDGLSGKSKSEYLTVFETGKNGTQKSVLQLPIFQETNWAKSS